MHMTPYSIILPFWISYGDIRWCFSYFLGRWSLEVQCDFANFVGYLTFHWYMFVCIDAHQGMDHHALPLTYYLISPWPSRPMYIVRCQDYWVGWSVSVSLPLGTFSGSHLSIIDPPLVMCPSPTPFPCICLWPRDLYIGAIWEQVFANTMCHYSWPGVWCCFRLCWLGHWDVRRQIMGSMGFKGTHGLSKL